MKSIKAAYLVRNREEKPTIGVFPSIGEQKQQQQEEEEEVEVDVGLGVTCIRAY